ncbi:hypothetical protein ACIBG8_11360 [Nonomuraea sp. NPDC050556]|uniref:hypothetical protein n=1 Tax=Nonomuraea sp. NPDC050556 TaxID=3364369 RepID=UPI0037B58E46
MRRVWCALFFLSLLTALPVPAAAAAVPEIAFPAPARVEVPVGPSLAAAKPSPPAPVRGPEVTVPAGSGLADQVAEEAADRLRAAGLPDGRPSVRGLLPSTDGAAVLELPRLVAATGLTYRLCARSSERPVACSIALPLAVPATADVTGDGRPDLVASLAPASTKSVAFTVRRLADHVRAQVWAEYELPGSGVLSAGLDGRGSDLSRRTRAVFTAADGKVTVDVRHTEPGRASTTFASLNGTLVSLRQSPVPARFTAAASLSAGRVDVTTSGPTSLDALLVTRTQFTGLRLAGLRAGARVQAGGGAVSFSGTVTRAEVHRYGYRDGVLRQATDVEVDRAPATVRVAYARQALTVDSTGRRASAARVRMLSGGTVVRADLSGVPSRVRLRHDLVAHRVTYTASSAIGAFAAILQRGGGAIATPSGAHITMIKKGDQAGVSVRLGGLSGFDVTYGSAPHALLRLDGGEPFLGAASIDGVHVARLELSNTPATAEVSLNPAEGTAQYRAAGVIDHLRAAYANTRSGLSVDGALDGIRSTVTASWRLGAPTTVEAHTTAPLHRLSLRATTAADNAASAAVAGLRGRLKLAVEQNKLTWTADHPVARLDARATAPIDGRTLTAAARVIGVPARFEATWGQDGYRFTGASGPLGDAHLAMTNHDGATAPTGPHLAAHYDAKTGDLDASARVRGLRTVAFTPASGGFGVEVRAARQKLALDGDLRLATGERAGILGRLGPLPGRLTVSSAGGPLTYTADAPIDLTARLWLGKAPDQVREAPGVQHGLSVVHDDNGVRAYADLTGLPTAITVDPAAKTFTFAGYHPRTRALHLFLDSKAVRAEATLTGLPSKVTKLALGPFDATGAAYRVEPATTLGSLRVRAQTGQTRGEVAISPVPATLNVSSAYGRRTSIRVANSTPVDRLSATVTTPAGTGSVRLTGIPATFGIDVDAPPEGGMGLPALTYNGASSTLDGSFQADPGLLTTVRGAALSFTDLGAHTTIAVRPDLSVEVASRPATGRLEVHAGLDIAPVPRQRVAFSKELPYTGGLVGYQMSGDFALGASRIGDLALAVRDLSWLRVRPGKVPLGLKAAPALGFVSPGFEGAYGTLTLKASAVDLNPDVRLGVKVSRKVGPEVFSESVRLGHADSLRMRRYDQQLRVLSARQAIMAGDLPVACVTLGTRPGLVSARGENAVTLRGKDGPQLVSLLDPGGQAPGYALDVLAHLMSPFPGADWSVSGVKSGAC